MNAIPIPDSAIGRVGMVAALHHINGEPDGRLVAVREPVGWVSQLLNAAGNVFAWQVLALGEPAVIDGRATRTLIVADRCLRPVSQLPDGEVERIFKQQTKEDFDAALADLHHIIERDRLTPEKLEEAVQATVTELELTLALEVVPIAQIAKEAGFKLIQADGDTMRWIGVGNGREFVIEGGPDWFGQWKFWAGHHTARTVGFDERQVSNEWPRGKIIAVWLSMWEEAMGKSTIPAQFELGLVYRKHQEDLRRLNLGLPFINVNGEAFRAARRWLARQFGNHLGNHTHNDLPVALRVVEDLLRVQVENTVYAVQAHSGWMDTMSVSLRDLLALSPWSLKGHIVRITWSDRAIEFKRGEKIARVDNE